VERIDERGEEIVKGMHEGGEIRVFTLSQQKHHRLKMKMKLLQKTSNRI
jgi:hypothetical protein